MPLKIQLVGGKEASAKLRSLPSKANDAKNRGLTKAALIVEGEAKRKVYAGRPDHLIGRSGRLRSSITHRVSEDFAEVGTNVVYAKIHEYGGEIVAKNAPFLTFKIDESWVRVKSVTIPKRPYLEPALEDKQPEVRKAFESEMQKEVDKLNNG